MISVIMDLIDTHQHLIYRNEANYSWAKDIPALSQSDFTVEDYQNLTKNYNILGTLFMECAVDDPDYKNESNFINSSKSFISIFIDLVSIFFSGLELSSCEKFLI